MDSTDKRLLNLLQTEVPITPRPWGVIGEQLGGISEAEVMERVRALKAAKIIRQISAIFDTRSLGYESSLVAAQYDPACVYPANPERFSPNAPAPHPDPWSPLAPRCCGGKPLPVNPESFRGKAGERGKPPTEDARQTVRRHEHMKRDPFSPSDGEKVRMRGSGDCIVPAESAMDAAAAIINEHPGVSHNYQRNHAFNLWYTIAVSPDSRLGLERTVRVLHETSGARSTLLLPTLHLFKIGVAFDIEGDTPADACGEVRYGKQQRGPACVADPGCAVGSAEARATSSRRRPAVAEPLTELEKQFVREMQRDIAIEPEPFAAIATRLGLSIERLREMSDAMHAAGRLRRVSAVLRHSEAGFAANAMGVWAARGTDAEILEAGEKMAGFSAVTHCYRRPTYPDWPYNLFTMVHGRTPAECDAVLAEISRKTGVTEHAALYSTKEYKKTRVEYFTDAEREWERRHIAADTPRNVVQ